MITLITGKPGSGKTLLAVEMIFNNSKSDVIRPCFSNIDGLDYKALNCFCLEEPKDWFHLPEGSFIFIDESQDFMPPRPSGKPIPKHVDMLNKHRHFGHDIVLITPDPKLLDVTARKTVGRHLHCYRPFGLEHRKVFEWNGCNESPEPSKNESNALVKKKSFDKKLFNYYKSAEIHTHKARMPWKKFVILFGAIFLAFFLFGYSFLSILSKPESNTINNETDTINNETDTINNETDILQSSISSDGLGISDAGSSSSLPPLAYYRGMITVGDVDTILIELVSGEYVYLDQFEGYKIDGPIIFVYFDLQSDPVFFIKNFELAAHLLGR